MFACSVFQRPPVDITVYRWEKFYVGTDGRAWVIPLAYDEQQPVLCSRAPLRESEYLEEPDSQWLDLSPDCGDPPPEAAGNRFYEGLYAAVPLLGIAVRDAGWPGLFPGIAAADLPAGELEFWRYRRPDQSPVLVKFVSKQSGRETWFRPLQNLNDSSVLESLRKGYFRHLRWQLVPSGAPTPRTDALTAKVYPVVRWAASETPLRARPVLSSSSNPRKVHAGSLYIVPDPELAALLRGKMLIANTTYRGRGESPVEQSAADACHAAENDLGDLRELCWPGIPLMFMYYCLDPLF